MFPSTTNADLAKFAAKLSQAPEVKVDEAGAYLKCNHKTGVWTYGREACEVDTLIVHPATCQHGWATREGINITGSELAPITESAPVKPANGNTLVEFSAVDADDHSAGLIFNTDSVGGTRAAMNLYRAIHAQASVNPAFIFPKVALSSASYAHRTYGTIYSPIFTVIEWLDADGTPA